MRTVFILLLVSFFSFASAVSGESNSRSSDDTTLRVGVIQSLSGIAAEDGKTSVEALKLAADEINRSADIRVDLFVEDDATDSKRSVSAYKKLQRKGVHAIIGPTWSFTVNSVLPLAGRDKLIMVNTSTIPECLELGKANGYGYSTATRVTEHVRAFDRYLTQHPASSVVIFISNNSWGHAQADGYRKILKQRKIKILDELESAGHDANDWRALLPKVKALNADLWLLLLNKSDLDIIIRRAREINTPARFFASYHFTDVLRIREDLRPFEEVCFPHPGPLPGSADRFAKEFRKRYREDPKVFSDRGYDTLFLLHKAFQLAQKKGISIQKALRKTTLQGVAGEYRFSEQSSFSIGRAVPMCVRSGAAVEIEVIP